MSDGGIEVGVVPVRCCGAEVDALAYSWPDLVTFLGTTSDGGMYTVIEGDNARRVRPESVAKQVVAARSAGLGVHFRVEITCPSCGVRVEGNGRTVGSIGRKIVRHGIPLDLRKLQVLLDNTKKRG